MNAAIECTNLPAPATAQAPAHRPTGALRRAARRTAHFLRALGRLVEHRGWENRMTREAQFSLLPRSEQDRLLDRGYRF